MNQVIDQEKTPSAQTNRSLNQLEQLKRFTRIVADTGDFATLKEYGPQDATTNPSLIFKAAQMPGYKGLVEKAIADNRKAEAAAEQALSRTVDDLRAIVAIHRKGAIVYTLWFFLNKYERVYHVPD